MIKETKLDCSMLLSVSFSNYVVNINVIYFFAFNSEFKLTNYFKCALTSYIRHNNSTDMTTRARAIRVDCNRQHNYLEIMYNKKCNWINPLGNGAEFWQLSRINTSYIDMLRQRMSYSCLETVHTYTILFLSSMEWLQSPK